MQFYLKYKDYIDRKAKAAPLQENDYCFILQPIADHQGSKIPFRESLAEWKLHSPKTQFQQNADLNRIRLRNYEHNTVLQDIRPEGNLQPDDEFVIPQDDFYVITWETNFGEFPNLNEGNMIPTRIDSADTYNSLGEDASPAGEILTDVNLRSTGPHENDNFVSPEKIRSERMNDWLDDQQSSGGSDTIVPEVSDEENDDDRL